MNSYQERIIGNIAKAILLTINVNEFEKEDAIKYSQTKLCIINSLQFSICIRNIEAIEVNEESTITNISYYVGIGMRQFYACKAKVFHKNGTCFLEATTKIEEIKVTENISKDLWYALEMWYNKQVIKHIEDTGHGKEKNNKDYI